MKDVLIVATGPHGFGGAVQAFSRALNALAHYGAKVIYVGLDKPFPLESLADNRIEFVHAALFNADAIGTPTSPIIDKHILAAHILSEAIVNTVRAHDFSRVVLWGTYLFPFAVASFEAYSMLEADNREMALWFSVSGSEIWEIGPKIPTVTRTLLEQAALSHIISSSQQFADVIQTRFGVQREIDVIYPMLDSQRFLVVSDQERSDIRTELNISANTFVMTCHCNMRAVKSPEDVLFIADKVAQKSKRPILLYMIGPIRKHLEIYAEETVHHATVKWLGIARDVEKYLYASDVELNCSSHDSFNMSLAEAMACAVPCVSTDVVGVADEILAAEAGFLFPYRPKGEGGEQRYSEAVDYILYLTESEMERRAIGKRAAKHAAKVFAPELITEQYLALFDS